jgi:competence ComEA-like helix-hairpin-helix protein
LPGLVLGLDRCQKAQLQTQRSAPLPQHPFVQIYFNHAQSSSYTEPYRNQTRPGDNFEQIIVDSIASAKTTIDVAVHELRLPRIAKALAERQKAGIRVRVILENTYTRPWSSLTAAEVAQLDERGRGQYQEFRQLVDRNQDGQVSRDEIKQGDALVVLKNAGVAWIDDTADGSAGSGLMHHKFIVVDRQTVIVTSANFTTSDVHGDFGSPNSQGNPNALLKIDHPGLASNFTQEFNLMWGDGPGKQPDSLFGLQKPFRPAQQLRLGDATVSVQFSPTSKSIPWEQSVNGLIGRTLNRATRSVDLALFVFSEQPLSTVLETKHQGGIDIRALIEPDYAYKSYSEGLDMLGVALAQSDKPDNSGYCQFEEGNVPWQQPIKTVGVPQLPEGDRLHHKFGVVDRQIVIVGSHNWSAAANQNNDENLLVIDNPMVAAHFDREFERLYANANLGIPKFLQRKIQKQTQCQTAVATPSSPGLPTITSSAQVTQSPTTAQVNLNTASHQELESLPGVGPKLAERIIQARQYKPFTSLSDLDQVPGVGPRLIDQLKERVTW